MKYYKSIATYYENPNSPTFHDQLNEENLGKWLQVDREIHTLTNLHEKRSCIMMNIVNILFTSSNRIHCNMFALLMYRHI